MTNIVYVATCALQSYDIGASAADLMKCKYTLMGYGRNNMGEKFLWQRDYPQKKN